PLVVGSYLPLKKATFAQSNVVPTGTPNVTVTNGMYKYEMMMVDDEGFESAPIFLGSMDLSAGNTITINNLWAVTGYNIEARKFYRTDAGGTPYQYIGATPTAADTTFTDNDLYVPNPTGTGVAPVAFAVATVLEGPGASADYEFRFVYNFGGDDPLK